MANTYTQIYIHIVFAVDGGFELDSDELARFLGGLFDIWMQRGYACGVSLGPFDALIDHFIGRPARLPCIWKENCSNQFISVDAKGSVAQCDCWVTSYPEYFFGNIFREPDLTRILKTSAVRRDFVERPKHLVEHEDCLSCRYLSICHGGCPVRTYSVRGTVMAKDPYCEVYKVVFARAEKHGQGILRRRLSGDGHRSTIRPKSNMDHGFEPQELSDPFRHN